MAATHPKPFTLLPKTVDRYKAKVNEANKNDKTKQMITVVLVIRSANSFAPFSTKESLVYSILVSIYSLASKKISSRFFPYFLPSSISVFKSLKRFLLQKNIHLPHHEVYF